MKKVVVCLLLTFCFMLSACGGKEESMSGTKDSNYVASDDTITDEDLLLGLVQIGNELAGNDKSQLPDLSDHEKGFNSLPIVTYQELKDNPSGFKELGLYKLGYDGSGEFMINPTAYQLDGVVIDFTDFDSIAQGISDFSQVFYMASGGNNGVTDNGLNPTSVEDIKSWLNKNIGSTREVKFTSEEMKGLSSDCNIDIFMVLSAENTIDYFSVKLYSSSKLSEQPIVVFETVGVNLIAVTKSGTQKLDFRYDM